MVGIFRFGGLHNVDIHETTFFSMFVSQTLGVANCTLTAEASHIEELDAQVKAIVAIVTSKLPS